MYLPIEAEAAAASQAAALPSGEPSGKENLPARSEPDSSPDSSLIPNVTKTAARWIRPFVPPIVARAIDTTTHPLRSARQVFEEVEEVTFSFKRTHKVTVNSEESSHPTETTGSVETKPAADVRRVESSEGYDLSPLGRAPANEPHRLSGRERPSELERGEGLDQISGRGEPRALPPAE